MYKNLISTYAIGEAIMARRYSTASAWVFTAIAAVTFGASAASAQDVAKGRQCTPPFYVFSPDIPHDIVTHDVGAIGFQPFADILAWTPSLR